LSDSIRTRSWVEVRDDFEHLSILLHLEKEDSKPHRSFKFNSRWLEDEGFLNSIKVEGIIYDDLPRESTNLQFVENI